MLKTVWKACEDELVRLVSVWKGLIAKCYPVRHSSLLRCEDVLRHDDLTRLARAQDDKGGGLDVGRQELHTFFSNAQLSPR